MLSRQIEMEFPELPPVYRKNRQTSRDNSRNEIIKIDERVKKERKIFSPYVQQLVSTCILEHTQPAWPLSCVCV